MSERPAARYPRGESGFTLLEMLVVIAIVSLVMIAVAPLANPWRRGSMVDVAAREVTLGLRATRAAAIYGNREATFTLDRAAARYWSDSAPAPKHLPARVVFAAGADEAATTRIRFFPDGGASGGTIVLSDAQRSASIRVDALSGRASVDVER
jgi:general secretion pathway protein H